MNTIYPIPVPGQFVKFKIQKTQRDGWSEQEGIVLSISTQDEKVFHVLTNSHAYESKGTPEGGNIIYTVHYKNITEVSNIEKEDLPRGLTNRRAQFLLQKWVYSRQSIQSQETERSDLRLSISTDAFEQVLS